LGGMEGAWKMRTQIIRLAMGILFFSVVALGCAPSPVYQVKYDYVVPESAEGKECTQQCEATKIQCEEVISKELEKERLSLQRAYQQCLLSQSAARSPILCTDQSQLIQVNYSNCLPDYNRCFERCGGRVTEKNICVRNCG